jgi:uncharacterized protein (TIGR03435 family)
MLPGGQGPDPPGEKVDASAPEFSAPSLFSALQDQLGLKLEPQKGPVEVFLVVSAERPAAN